MSVLQRVRGHLSVLGKAKRNRGDLVGWLVRRPPLLIAHGTFESSLLLLGRLPSELKALATCKAAMVVNCEFCLDIGAEIARSEGIAQAKLEALLDYADSPELSAEEKLVVEYAEAVSSSPALVSEELLGRLRDTFTRAQLTELASEIAWENQRARLNQALGVRPAGFSDGSYCLIGQR